MERWKSQREIADEIRDYKRKRFDFHMELEVIGVYPTRELALAAFRAELEEDDPPTVSIDPTLLDDMLTETE